MTEPRPRWSVLIPTCNPDADLLRAAVDSVRNADDAGERELLIVDDASDVSTGLAALAAMERDGIRIERTETRGGLAANFNRCIALASGEIIHILHQDDRILPGFYAHMAAGFDAVPAVGAAFSAVQFIDANGVVQRETHHVQQRAGVLEHWIEHIVANLAVQTAGIVVRKDVYHALGGFRDDYAYVLDWEMWARIARHYPIWFDPTPLAQRREHSKSESARLYELGAPWHERRRLVRELAASLPDHVRPKAEAAARGHLVRLARAELRALLRRGRWRAALSTALGGLRLGPRETLLRRWYYRAPPPVLGPRPEGADNAVRPRSRLLIMTEFVPDPRGGVATGALQRLDHNIRTLAAAGEVDAVFLARFRADTSHERAVRRQWPFLRNVEFVMVPTHPMAKLGPRALIAMRRGALSFIRGTPDPAVAARPVARRLDGILARVQPDLVFAYGVGAAAALLPLAEPHGPVVTDMFDVEHVKATRLAAAGRASRSWRARWRRALAVRAERAVLRLSRLTLVCSESDASELARLDPAAEVSVIANTANVDAMLPLPEAARALFVGTMKYPPNARAALWLARDIWPRVRRGRSDAVLVIAGEDSEKLDIHDPAKGIELLGRVDDLGAVYRAARVCLCPIREGSGTRIKLIEAALYGRPSVSTTIGAEGLDFETGREIAVADTADAFADACVRLLDADCADARAMAEAARARAAAAYSPERRHAVLLALVERCIANADTRSEAA